MCGGISGHQALTMIGHFVHDKIMLHGWRADIVKSRLYLHSEFDSSATSAVTE
jgi:hypothetical protein